MSARTGSSRRHWRLVAQATVAVMICILPAGEAFARQYRYGDIEISELDVPTTDSSHGYVAYRYTIVNRSTSRGHTVTLSLPARSSSAGLNVSTSATVGPGTTTVMSLLQPPLDIGGGDDVAVSIDGMGRHSISQRLVRHGRQGIRVCLLAARSQAENVREANKEIGRRADVEFEVAQSPIGVAQWATSWLEYSRYDGVVVSSGDFSSMPPAVREAVLRYVACGGTLTIVGVMDPPEEWRTGGYSEAGMMHYCIGLGTCILAPADMRFRARGAWERWRHLFRMWESGAISFGGNMDVNEANRMLPVVEDVGIPTGGMFVVMLVFAVLAGPVNLIVLWKFHRRIWMLWTVPAVSIVTCLTIFLYAFLAEGWTGHVRTASITILDQRNHRAATIGWTGFYSPMTPGDGLHFGLETEVVPQWGGGEYDEYDDRYYDYENTRAPRAPGGGTIHTDWSQDQHLRGAWISARVPVHFRIRKAETRRERLNVTIEDDGTVTVVNGLGARITRLVLADAGGRIHEAADIDPGAKAQLDRSSQRVRLSDRSTAMKRLRTSFGDTRSGVRWDLIEKAENFLLPNCYIAELDGAPFVETAMPGAEHEKSRSVVYGIIGGGDGS